jgi:hypothetical protein
MKALERCPHCGETYAINQHRETTFQAIATWAHLLGVVFNVGAVLYHVRRFYRSAKGEPHRCNRRGVV